MDELEEMSEDYTRGCYAEVVVLCNYTVLLTMLSRSLLTSA